MNGDDKVLNEVDVEMADIETVEDVAAETASVPEKEHKDTGKKIIIILLILLLLAMGGVIAFLLLRKPAAPEPKPQGNIMIDTRANSETETVKNPLADRVVHFAGIEDADIGAESVVLLENMPENEDFYMTYKIEDADTGEVYEETDLIPAGEHVTWEVGKALKTPGEYHLNFHEAPFWKDADGNLVPLTSGNNQVTFTVH